MHDKFMEEVSPKKDTSHSTIDHKDSSISTSADTTSKDTLFSPEQPKHMIVSKEGASERQVQIVQQAYKTLETSLD